LSSSQECSRTGRDRKAVILSEAFSTEPKDPHFQKLVVERDALDHQIQLRQKELDGIKSAPDYSKNSTLLIEAYEINNAIETLNTWKKYDDSRITKMVHLEPVDFGDDNTPPAPKNNIDKIVVPPPTH